MSKILEELFENNFDCYADTWKIEQGNYPVEGEVVMAMAKEKFVSIFQEHTKQNIEALRSELLKGVNEENFVYEVINLRINQFLENIK